MVALCQCGCGQPAPLAPHNNVTKGYVKGMPLPYRHGHHAHRLKTDTRPIMARLAEKSKLNPETGCIEWTGSLHKEGYAHLSVNGRLQPVHRLAWAEVNGLIPEGRVICHKCDNRKCLNPDHLFVGTVGDNNSDRARKGRDALGSRNGKSKLVESDVLEIRALQGKQAAQQVADRFGISKWNVYNIWHRQTWRHLRDPL